jgi:hypothetical protein
MDTTLRYPGSPSGVVDGKHIILAYFYWRIGSGLGGNRLVKVVTMRRDSCSFGNAEEVLYRLKLGTHLLHMRSVHCMINKDTGLRVIGHISIIGRDDNPLM